MLEGSVKMEIADFIKLVTEQGVLVAILAWFMFSVNKAITEMTHAIERNTNAITQLLTQHQTLGVSRRKTKPPVVVSSEE
jgi:uncharacterized radical SAM superfamily Fe-S cluster-containing enzyme